MKNSDFIEALKSAIGNERKISELLSHSNISALQQYLISIGVDSNLTHLAAVMEITRTELANILKHPNCEITSQGIKYNDDSLYVEDGTFYLSHNKSFSKGKNDNEILFYHSAPELCTETTINEYGAVIYTQSSGNSPFAGEYSTCARTILNNFPMVKTYSTDGASYIFSEEAVDFGHPLYPDSKKSEFQENYYTYGNIYPKLKEWYDTYFPMQNKDEFECTSFLNQRQFELDINKLTADISKYTSSIAEQNSNNAQKQENLNNLLEYIKRLQKRNPIGKLVADRILGKVATIRPQKATKRSESSETSQPPQPVKNENESLFEKKSRLKATLANLKKEYGKVSAESCYLKEEISTIQEELSQIPLIGNRLYKSATKKTTKKSASYADGPEQ